MTELNNTSIKYISRNIRIGADIPRDLRDRLYAKIPPGMLSTVIRELLEEYLKLDNSYGTSLSLKSILNKKIIIELKTEL